MLRSKLDISDKRLCYKSISSINIALTARSEIFFFNFAKIKHDYLFIIIIKSDRFKFFKAKCH